MSTEALTKDELRYVAELLKVSEACKKNGESFEGVVSRELSRLLGASAGRATMFHLGPESLSDPVRLVEKLTVVFGSGADLLLQKLAAAGPPLQGGGRV
jgi:hypothetical protein